MKARYFFAALVAVAVLADTQTAKSQIANITNDVTTEFGAYHPYLVTVTPAVATYTFSSDFSDVAGFSRFSSAFSEADRSLLKQNHFVSKPSQFKQIYSVYNNAKENGVSQFVTTDAMLHTFHIMYDYALRILEVKRFADDVKALNHALLGRFKNYYSQINNPADSSLRTIIEKDIAYFTVVEYIPQPSLLGGSQLDPSEAMAAEELGLIAAHEGFAQSPIFGYPEDYSQYVPRGHYTRNDTLRIYFKQMMWYGRMMFRVSPPKNEFTDEIDEEKAKEETLMAILIVRAMNELTVNGEPALNPWSRIYYPTTFFVGKSDDLDIVEYATLIRDVYGEGYLSLPLQAFADTVKLSEFITKARQLRDPLINSSWVSETQDPKLVTKAFRFMGQRFIPDSYMFTELVHAKVLHRFFPKGLDVFSVMGSERAYLILDKVFGETNYSHYSTQMDSLKREFVSLTPQTWAQNLYWNWLYCLMAMLMPKGEGYPPFMRNTAWVDKDLFTALSSWGELRHDTILYAKQSYGQITSMPTPPSFTYGYVEPNPHLFARLASLINLLRIGLDNMGLGLDEFRFKFTDLESLLLGLKTIAQKELENKELTLEEYKVIWTIGEHLESLLTFSPETAGTITSDTDNEMAVVADVHTDPNTQQVLEEGVGYPFYLYVIVKDTNGLRMTLGAMFSYYEFTHPMADRLTDEAWQSTLKGSAPPGPPVWAGSFMDLSQSFLNVRPADFHVRTSNYTDFDFSLLPEHPSSGDTLTLRVLYGWPISDTMHVVFSRDGQQLSSTVLVDLDTSSNAEFRGTFPTQGWSAGAISIQLSAAGFSNTCWFELGTVSVVPIQPQVPESYQLFQNYPNPFNPTTTIQYSVPVTQYVSLKIYDVLGREVASLVDETRQPGTYTVRWKARGCSSGVYFYRMKAGNPSGRLGQWFVETRKLVLVR
jgi:hypothetical protein